MMIFLCVCLAGIAAFVGDGCAYDLPTRDTRLRVSASRRTMIWVVDDPQLLKYHLSCCDNCAKHQWVSASDLYTRKQAFNGKAFKSF